jgi:chromosome condensin MukBEF ATPase and DNA-binding subunit MukB
VPQSLKKRAADLERRVEERAEAVKRVLKEYRETQRATTARAKGSLPGRLRARLNRKRLDVERATAEYIQLQKELENLRNRIQARG